MLRRTSMQSLRAVVGRPGFLDKSGRFYWFAQRRKGRKEIDELVTILLVH